ncbi:phage portal protein [Schleiferilactobacillus shenzhenensis]|uniref:Phage portal protein n=1 Tax=Schleiferilactobacillus shenzhenensis LY-73 TaxID=1231336 RepID=U4TQ65_9LACO|nr:phage portal protein [Schleiferilactobacillus shenzhenensis]ERL64043.1 hypothetical protein L248_1690 [Schleiferilactobacillus shenzhenensis LY-73]
MAFFRSLSQNATDADPHWADDYFADGTLPAFRGGYVGIGALRNSDVLTAVSIIAGDVSRFPLIIKDRRTDAVIDMDDIDYLVNVKANKRLSAYQWRFSMMVNAILTGNAYSRIVRDPLTGAPAMFEFYAPSQTSIDTTDLDHIKYTFTPYNSLNQKVVSIDDVIHFKFFSYDTITGRSPLLSLGQEIGLQEAGIQTLTKFFGSGLKGSILKAKGAKLSPEARKKTREEFERAQEGATAGSPIVIDETTDYKPLEVDTSVLQLINSNNYSTAQIAKALRVPAYRLAQNSPNQSVSQLSDDYIRQQLPFYFLPITSEFEMKLLDDTDRHQYRFDFDTRSVNPTPIAEVNTAVGGGIITANEGRASLGKKPLNDPHMDQIMSTLNTVSLDIKDEYQQTHNSNGSAKATSDDAKN